MKTHNVIAAMRMFKRLIMVVIADSVLFTLFFAFAYPAAAGSTNSSIRYFTGLQSVIVYLVFFSLVIAVHSALVLRLIADNLKILRKARSRANDARQAYRNLTVEFNTLSEAHRKQAKNNNNDLIQIMAALQTLNKKTSVVNKGPGGRSWNTAHDN